jgi:CRISPR/Cas system-associated exonuclease Cas4 (RecB family)
MEQNLVNKLSASAISTYLACPLKYKFRYIDKIDAPSDSPHLIYGTSIHKAIEEFHKSIWLGDKITRAQAVSIFVNSWELGLDFNEVPVKWYRASSKKEMLQSGIDSIKNYYEVHKKDTSPPSSIGYDKLGQFALAPAVELYFMLPLDKLIGRTGWFINGVIDLVQNNSNEILVVDHKTGSDKYSEFKVKTDLQLAIYSYAFRELCGTGAFPEFLPDTKEDYVMFDIISKKKPEIFYHKRKITEATYKHLGTIISRIIGQIEKEEFLPNYGPTCDSFGGCEYRDICADFKFK